MCYNLLLYGDEKDGRSIVSKLSYKKLFKKMIDIEMKNTELMEKAKVSKSTFYKIKNGENVTNDVLLRICIVLECDISEIVECVNIKDGGNTRV